MGKRKIDRREELLSIATALLAVMTTDSIDGLITYATDGDLMRNFEEFPDHYLPGTKKADIEALQARYAHTTYITDKNNKSAESEAPAAEAPAAEAPVKQKSKNMPTTLVVRDRRLTLRQKRANALVEAGALYVDDAGESKPKRPHLHVNPEHTFGLFRVEDLLLAIKQ